MKVGTSEEQRLEAVGEITDHLQRIWQLMEDGRVETLQPDPFFKGRGDLTPKVVEDVVHRIEFNVFEHELKNFRGWHNEAQGVKPGEKLVRPGFAELPYQQKLALVQGVYRILEKYRA